jgi:hypothetical protein
MVCNLILQLKFMILLKLNFFTSCLRLGVYISKLFWTTRRNNNKKIDASIFWRLLHDLNYFFLLENMLVVLPSFGFKIMIFKLLWNLNVKKETPNKNCLITALKFEDWTTIYRKSGNSSTTFNSSRE